MKEKLIKAIKVLTAAMGFVYVIVGIVLLINNPIPEILNDLNSKIFGILALSYGCMRVWRTLFKRS